MRVAVTGGTGFVGSHTVAALLGAGHSVKLLVRRPDGVPAALEPLGVDPATVEVEVADVTDRAAVAAGLKGTDAVVHAASVYTFHPRRLHEMKVTNEQGVRNVLESAADAGLDPIVHVSSMLALYRDGAVGETLDPESPPGNSPHPYAGGKARQEAFAQDLQHEGAPVVITNPGGVLGPHDPHDGESVQLFRSAVKGRLDFMPEMSGAWVDVRDVAAIHVAVMEPGKGPRRFIAGGHAVSIPHLVEMITTAHGKPRTPKRVPLGVARVVGAIGNTLMRMGVDLGISPEAIWVGARHAIADNSETERQLGVSFRPTEESVEDQVRWMVEAGRF